MEAIKIHERAKSKFAGVVVLKTGNFYETFWADALLMARECGLSVTHMHKSGGFSVPMAGYPAHHHDAYVAKLAANGHQVLRIELAA